MLDGRRVRLRPAREEDLGSCTRRTRTSATAATTSRWASSRSQPFAGTSLRMAFGRRPCPWAGRARAGRPQRPDDLDHGPVPRAVRLRDGGAQGPARVRHHSHCLHGLQHRHHRGHPVPAGASRGLQRRPRRRPGQRPDAAGPAPDLPSAGGATGAAATTGPGPAGQPGHLRAAQLLHPRPAGAGLRRAVPGVVARSRVDLASQLRGQGRPGPDGPGEHGRCGRLSQPRPHGR